MSPETLKPSASPVSTGRKPGGPEKPNAGTAKLDPRFRAEMPQIPGVAHKSGQQAGTPQQTMRLVQIVGAVVVLGSVAGWWLPHGSRSAGASAGQDQATAPRPAPAELPPLPIAPTTLGRNEIGKVEDFAQPWSVKKFNYTSLLNRDVIPAIVVRLPTGDGKHAESYWGVLLKAPFAQCDLEFVSDLNRINTQFGYRATHPMVVDSCSGIVYDPLRTGTLPDGTWSRGDIVKGQGLRPPLQVEIKIEGGRLIAGRAE